VNHSQDEEELFFFITLDTGLRRPSSLELSADRLRVGCRKVFFIHHIRPRGEKMLYSGTDPDSYITKYTFVYEDLKNLRLKNEPASV